MCSDMARDFAVIFSYQWYQGFPVHETHRLDGGRADWTTHIALTFRKTTDLFGYFSHFESGGRCDAVIKDSYGEPVAFAEWEWIDPSKTKINEVEKLFQSCKKNNPKFCFLLTYCDENNFDGLMQNLMRCWESEIPLILGVVTYEGNGYREFKELIFSQIKNTESHEIRRQPALPWHVTGSKWKGKN